MLRLLFGIFLIILGFLLLFENLPTNLMAQNLPAKPLQGIEYTLALVTDPEKAPVAMIKKEKLILLWTKFWGLKLWNRVLQRINEKKCEVSNCVFTHNKRRLYKSDAVLFHLIDLQYEHYKFPNYHKPTQNWVIIDYESPCIILNSGINTNRLNNIFNRTMSLRSDADVTVNFGEARKFTGNKIIKTKNWVDSHDDIRFRNYAANKTNLVAWFASGGNCKSYSNRELYVQELQKVVPVHVYGKCGIFKCGKSKIMTNVYKVEEDECYKLISENYKFYLSFENSLCKDYVTEKLFNILRLNVIPIVFGKANYSAIAPPHSVIDAMKFTPTELGKYLKLLDSNDALYNEYFKWKSDFEVIGYNSVPNPCDLCKKLNSVEWKTQQKTIKNFTEWFVDKSECISGYKSKNQM